MRILLISGPPRSGKTTVAQATQNILLGESSIPSVICPIAGALKEATHGAYAVLNRTLGIPNADYFENCKEDKHEFFFGISPRQAYIDFHEKYLRPVHGAGFVSSLCAKKLMGWTSKEVGIVPDLGNYEQALSFRAFEHVVVLRLERQGATWRDNRVPVDAAPLGYLSLSYQNDGSIEDMKHWIKTTLLPAILS